MKMISLEELYTLDFEITSIFAQRQKWIDGVLFQRRLPREAGGFLYLNGCTGQYTDFATGKTFFAPLKSLVYLPYGGRYSVLNLESRKASVDAYLVEFNIVAAGETVSLAPMPERLARFSPYYIEKLMSETVNAYEAGERSPSVLKSKIYELLAYLSNTEDADTGRAGQVLKPALEHIEKNAFEQCSMENLAQMCGLSTGGFRRLFRQHTGKTPKEYVLEIKTATAKTLLEESNMTVNEISEVLNFDTPAYFCRFFKNRTGHSPSRWRNGAGTQRDGL